MYPYAPILSIYTFLLNRGDLGLAAVLIVCLTSGSVEALAAQIATRTTGAVNGVITDGDHRTARFSDRRALIS